MSYAWLDSVAQEIPEPGSLSSPLPGGLARVVRFFLDFPQPLQIAGVVVGASVGVVLAFVLWRRRAGVWRWLTSRPRMVYAWAAAVGCVLVVGGAGVGVWGLHYVEHDNGFCTGCHVMGPAFLRFTGSEHSQLECHDCHRQPMTASLRQLYLWVVERPEEIAPHAPVPTAICSECHVRDDPRETWQAIAATQGHATHLGSSEPALAEVECVTCHGREVHRFVPAEETCAQSGCHAVEETRVALGAMSGQQTSFHCLGCHNFTAPPGASGGVGEPGLVPGIDACQSCHQMATLVEDIMPESDPHDAVCGSCHDPHAQATPAAAYETCTATGCHSSPETLTAFHRGLHDDLARDCARCHVAHGWRVEGGDCRSCHTTLSD